MTILNNLRNNTNIIILSAEKGTVQSFLTGQINDGISQGKYVESVSNTHQDLKHFQNFLFRHFYKTEYYDKMRPISNQPARFCTTAKTHKYSRP